MRHKIVTGKYEKITILLGSSLLIFDQVLIVHQYFKLYKSWFKNSGSH